MKAIDDNFLDIQFVAFVDVYYKHGAGTLSRTLLNVVIRLGKIITFLAVEFGNFLQIIGHHLLVEHAARLCTHCGDNVFRINVFGTLDDNIVDAGFFNNGKDKHIAFHGSRNVAEIAHVPNALDFLVYCVRIRMIAAADGKAHQYRIRIHDIHAAHAHICQSFAGIGRAAHGHKTGLGFCLRWRLGNRARHVGRAFGYCFSTFA